MAATGLLATARRSQGLRLLVLAFLALLLLIPVGMVEGVIQERRARRDEAVASVAASWGGAQRIAGPRLVVPFVERWQETLEDGEKVSRERHDVAVFLPKTLDVTVLRRAGRAGVVAGIVATLYAYLFVLLTNEDYALLAGALGLFAALAAVMWLTRRVDWRDVAPTESAAQIS